MSARLEVSPVGGRRDLTQLVELPWRLYHGCPCWVAPLRRGVRRAVPLSVAELASGAGGRVFGGRRYRWARPGG